VVTYRYHDELRGITMPKKDILDELQKDQQLAKEVLSHLLAEEEMVYETLTDNFPLRQELLGNLLEKYCLSQAEFAEATGADNARITRDVDAGNLRPVHVFGNKKYYYTRLFWKDDIEKYSYYVEISSRKPYKKPAKRTIKRKEKEKDA